MERRMTASRVSSVRRPTEASKALSVSKDKSLSTVSLTKRTNSLAFDVEEIRNNLQELQVQGREVVQHEQTVQELSAKVFALQQAFDSVSDVCIYVEDAQNRMTETVDRLVQRVTVLEKSVGSLQSHVPKADAKRKQLQDMSDRRFSDFQEAFAKLSLSVYETQAELSRVKNSTDDLLSRERETMHHTQALQATQEQATEWLTQLKHESAQLGTELFTLKEHSSATNVALASDIQTLANECTSVRSTIVQHQAQWQQKLDALRETMDRQNKVDKSQLVQRLDTLAETVFTHEQRTKDVMGTILKNHARIREAVDESMAICSTEIKLLSQETKAVHQDHTTKLEELVQQLALQSLDTTQQYETLRCSVQSMAIQLDIPI